MTDTRTTPTRTGPFILLGAAGLAVALLSFLEPRIPRLAELCGFLGGGCRDTAAFTLLGVPVAVLGVAYYVLFLASLLLARSWRLRVIMAGVGAELTFVYAMIVHGLFCPFCLLNLLVVAALAALAVQRGRGWEALAVALLFLVLTLIPFNLENAPPGAPAQAPTSDEAVARVAGEPVTRRDLERSMASRLYDERMRLYVEKMKALDQIIEERLVRLEARRRGKPEEEIRSAALKTVKPVTPDDVEAFLSDNPDIRSSWQGSEGELLEKVRSFLQKRRSDEAIKTYMGGLRDRYGVEVLLEEPSLPLTRVALGNSPTQGPADAPVTVVEFSDYACPACREAHEITMEVREAFRGRIRWVFKDFPLDRHQGARTMAEAARCAREQGLFWEYQDMLFLSQGTEDRERLADLAAELGMDRGRFAECLESGRHRKDVMADVRAAEEAGVEVTPTFIVNGKLRPGTPGADELRALIEAELEQARPPEAAR